MIIKQLVKTLPIAIRGELNGKDVIISFIFLGRNYLKLKITQRMFIGLRNFIEEIYQESLDSYKGLEEKSLDRAERQQQFKHLDPNRNVDIGFGKQYGMTAINDRVPLARGGVRVN